jgi:hypothetical protein
MQVDLVDLSRVVGEIPLYPIYREQQSTPFTLTVARHSAMPAVIDVNDLGG